MLLNDDPPEGKVKDWLGFMFEGFETENPNLWSEYSEDLDD